MGYLYEITLQGKHIVNGSSSGESRPNTLKRILETKEIPASNHAKSFIVFLAIRLYDEKDIKFDMWKADNVRTLEKERHQQFGGNKMKDLAKELLAKLIAKKGLRLSPETLHVLNMYCVHGDTFSKSRASLDTLPQHMKEEMECLFKI